MNIFFKSNFVPSRCRDVIEKGTAANIKCASSLNDVGCHWGTVEDILQLTGG